MNSLHSLISHLKVTNDTRALAYLLLSGLICLMLFPLASLWPARQGHLVASDGIDYYVVTRSLLLDHDFDLANDYELLSVPVPSSTSTGLAANPFPIGAAILWAPFFTVAHIVSLALAAAGYAVPTNGTGWIYEASVSVGTVLYATAGLILTYRVIRGALLADAPSSLLAVLAMGWATPAIYYIVVEPSMSHGLTIFSIAVFLCVWYPPSPQRSIRNWFAIGMACALVFLVRWQDGIIAVIPIVELGWWILKQRTNLMSGLGDFVGFGMLAAIFCLPQLAMWNSIYGTLLTIPQGSDFINWMSPQPLDTLFSTRHGLITWHPVLGLAALGLFPLWKQNRVLALTTAFMLIGELYVNSSVTRWWADEAFGARRFTSLIPLLAAPLASLLNKRYLRLRWGVLIIIALVIWNLLSLGQYTLGLISKSGALTIQEMTVDRLQVPITLLRRIIY